MKVLLPYFKRYIKSVLGAGISIFIATFTALWIPRMLQQVLNAITADQRGLLLQYGSHLLLLALAGVVFGILGVVFAARVTQGVTNDLRADLYAKIQTFSYANIEEFSSGSLVVRLVNDMNQVMNLVMNGITQIVRVPFMFVGALALGIATIPRLWWIFAAAIILTLLVAFLVFSRMGKLFSTYQVKMDRINNKAKEALQGIRVIKSFNQEDNETKRFKESSDDLNNLNLKIGYLFSASYPAFMIVSYCAIGMVLFMVSANVAAHAEEIAAVSSFITYLMQMLFAIMIAGMLITMMSRGMVALKRINEVMQTKPALTFDPDAPEQELSGDVEFDHVFFKYPKDENMLLKDISFKVKEGEMIGIVGATGSGKTSMAQLIPRLFDPDKGVVKVGGVDLRQVNEKSLRKAVSFVLQRATLFSGTIKSNLLQGKHDATLQEMRMAARMSQASEFISNYHDEFDHEIEERSANLSGGQKQRLSLARGLISNPKILILDDSTSALDAHSEKLVQEALTHHLKDTTTFIIAEKIMSVINADRILVLKDGRLIATGTHEELLKNSPDYREIYETQAAESANFH